MLYILIILLIYFLASIVRTEKGRKYFFCNRDKFLRTSNGFSSTKKIGIINSIGQESFLSDFSGSIICQRFEYFNSNKFGARYHRFHLNKALFGSLKVRNTNECSAFSRSCDLFSKNELGDCNENYTLSSAREGDGGVSFLGTDDKNYAKFRNKKILSGIRPTGIPHLGTYLAVLKPLYKLQQGGAHTTLLIADEHGAFGFWSKTLNLNISKKGKNIFDIHKDNKFVDGEIYKFKQIRNIQHYSLVTLALAHACGIKSGLHIDCDVRKPSKNNRQKNGSIFKLNEHSSYDIHNASVSKKSNFPSNGNNGEGNTRIFLQSSIPYHCQLATWLMSITPLGWVKHCSATKEALQTGAGQSSCGVLFYPILMTADILLHGCEYVLAGRDQRQHVELARAISRKLKSLFLQSNKSEVLDSSVLSISKCLHVSEHGYCFNSLTNPTQKMGKSSVDNGGIIYMLDDEDTIKYKIRKAVTDNNLVGKVFDPEGRPGGSNLFKLYSALKDISPCDIASEFEGTSWSAFKDLLADEIIKELKPIQQRYNKFIKKKDSLLDIISKEQECGKKYFKKKMQTIGSLFGFCPTI